MKLKSSFQKLRKKLLHITLVEILNFLCILALIGGMGALFSSLAGDLQDLTPKVSKVKELTQQNKITGETKDTMDEGILIMKTFFLKLITGLIAFLALMVAITTLTKGFIYSRYSNLKLKEFIKRFAKANIPWQLAWLALFILTLTIIRKDIAPVIVVIELILYLLFTPQYRAAFTKHLHAKAFFKHLKNFHLYLLPVFIISLVGLLNVLIWVMIIVKPGLIFIILNSAFTLFLFIWGRTYILEIAGDIK